MKICELKNAKELHQSKDNNDLILTVFNDEDDHDAWLAELCQDLLCGENAVQMRMILKLYLEDMLEDVKWGGTEV